MVFGNSQPLSTLGKNKRLSKGYSQVTVHKPSNKDDLEVTSLGELWYGSLFQP